MSKKTRVSFAPFAAKMEAAGLPEIVTDNFRYYFDQLVHGATGYIPGSQAQPVAAVPEYGELDHRDVRVGHEALARAIVLKLNGGLGTGMGMNGPKSLLPVKDGLTFLDIIVRQVRHLRWQTGARLPLVLMDSFSTVEPTAAALRAYPDFTQDLPISFQQHMVPKIWTDSLTPASWPADPEKEWCPPGHGDIYPALITSGMLAQMLGQGYEYLFVSNADNLGATLDLGILGFFARHHLPFLMEVAERTTADRKGGHLAQQEDGHLLLRESAQCPPEEESQFQDIRLYRFFNTNNLWIHLPTLARLTEKRHGVLGLPLIRNEKPIDPADPATPRVFQLETAMGAAISVFRGAQALLIPRSRFVPVKKNSDLLVLTSDAYLLNEDYTLQLAAERGDVPPVVALDDRYYSLIDQMSVRFPCGAPSLRLCDELRVTGDVRFGQGVVVEGSVTLKVDAAAPLHIANETVLRG